MGIFKSQFTCCWLIAVDWHWKNLEIYFLWCILSVHTLAAERWRWRRWWLWLTEREVIESMMMMWCDWNWTYFVVIWKKISSTKSLLAKNFVQKIVHRTKLTIVSRFAIISDQSNIILNTINCESTSAHGSNCDWKEVKISFHSIAAWRANAWWVDEKKCLCGRATWSSPILAIWSLSSARRVR